MNPPGDLPGPLTAVSLTVLVVTVVLFAAFTLGGHRASSAVRRLLDDATSLAPVYALAGGLVAAMGLGLGTAFASYRYEAALHDLAWEAYDVWIELDAAAAPPVGEAAGAGTSPAGAVWAVLALVVLGILGLVLYVVAGFDRAASRRRAVGWGAALTVSVVVLLGLAVVVMWHDVGVREQAWELWLGQEVR